MKKALLIVASVLLIDQALKIWVKLNMSVGENIIFTDWFRLHFTENPGMAFGLEWGGVAGKLALSLFRLGAIIGIFYWLKSLLRKGIPTLGIVAVSLILAGAIGNLLDSAFYGLLFDKGLSFDEAVGSYVSYSGLAQLNGEGYANFLTGSVVDMLYFPLYEGYLPDWIPFKGGDYFVFFRPIFNLADASISVGVGLLILFQKKAFPKEQ